MKLTDSQRQAIINHLTTNSEAWKGSGDAQILASMPDTKLVQLKDDLDQKSRAVAVANAAVHGFSDGETAYRLNGQTGKWERKVVANAEEDEEEEEMEDEEEEETPRKKKQTNNVANFRAPQTPDEWLRRAPETVQNTFRYASMIETREKNKIIDQLLANVSDQDKAAHRERLVKRSLIELENDLLMMPKAAPVPETPATNGNGTAGSRRQVAANGSFDNDILVPPSSNWEPEANGGMGEDGFEPLTNEGLEVVSEEAALRNLPPSLRRAVNNAKLIEQREKDRLIQELTANMADGDIDEAGLVRRLQNKSLEELQDMLAIIPRRQPTNFFGASAPIGNRFSGNGADEVLPLPTVFDWEN